MTKARTKGQKRRGRPKKDGPRDPKTGRLSRIPVERREDAQRVVVVARCKAMGWLPFKLEDGKLSWQPTEEMFRRASADHMGCTAGRAIDRESPDVRSELWGAVKTIAKTYVRYWAAIGAPPPYAKAAMITYLPEILGSDGVEASTWDDRPEADRVRAATNAVMRIEQVLGSAGEGVAAEVKGVVLQGHQVSDYRKLVAGLQAVLA